MRLVNTALTQMGVGVYEYRTALNRVIDGDTVVLTIDLGFRIRHDVTVRLLGVDCPELVTPAGKQARDAAAAWFAAHRHAADGLTARTHRHATDKYGRYLAEIVCPVDGADLVADLVAAGHVKTTAPALPAPPRPSQP